jgi:two-component system, LytTR family, response regulator
MRIAIVEDEEPARARLSAAIRKAAPDAEIVAELAAVSEAVEWLESNPAPDLLFLDIQLGDGVSFEILRRTRVECPVVFATAYDEYLIDAFLTNGIDYLLKPIPDERVAAAIAKYRGLKRHFGAEALLDSLRRPPASYRERILVRKGGDLTAIRTADIAYFHTSDKLVTLTTKSGVRFALDRPLAELEAELDPKRFFRANRAFLANIDAVARCSAYGKGKLLIELRPAAGEDVVVSQERAGALRKWLGE